MGKAQKALKSVEAKDANGLAEDKKKGIKVVSKLAPELSLYEQTANMFDRLVEEDHDMMASEPDRWDQEENDEEEEYFLKDEASTVHEMQTAMFEDMAEHN